MKYGRPEPALVAGLRLVCIVSVGPSTSAGDGSADSESLADSQTESRLSAIFMRRYQIAAARRYKIAAARRDKISVARRYKITAARRGAARARCRAVDRRHKTQRALLPGVTVWWIPVRVGKTGHKQARGPDSATCAGLAHVRDYSDRTRASEQISQKCLGHELLRILENKGQRLGFSNPVCGETAAAPAASSLRS